MNSGVRMFTQAVPETGKKHRRYVCNVKGADGVKECTPRRYAFKVTLHRGGGWALSAVAVWFRGKAEEHRHRKSKANKPTKAVRESAWTTSAAEPENGGAVFMAGIRNGGNKKARMDCFAEGRERRLADARQTVHCGTYQSVGRLESFLRSGHKQTPQKKETGSLSRPGQAFFGKATPQDKSGKERNNYA